MFCYNCGNNLGTNEKVNFCPFCGIKFSQEDIQDKAVSINTEEPENAATKGVETKKESIEHKKASQASAFSLYGFEIPVGTIKEVYSVLTASFYKLANDGYDQMLRAFEIKNNAAAVVRNLEKDYTFLLNQTVKTAVRVLKSVGITDYNENDFFEEYLLVVKDFNNAFYDFVCEYEKIISDDKIAQEYINANKENRARFVGGGFGLSGAVKGMMMAGAANAVSGLFSSMSASMERAKTDRRLQEQLYVLCSKRNGMKLADGAKRDVFAALQIIEAVLIRYKGQGYKNPFSAETIRESDLLFERICNNEFSENDAKKYLVLALINKPFDTELVRYAFERFGDDNGNLTKFVDGFGNLFDIEQAKADLKNKHETDGRLKKVFGNDSSRIKKRFLKYSNYATALTENIGKDFPILYQAIIDALPSKLYSLSYRYCWEEKYRLDNNILSVCRIDIDVQNIPVLAIDISKEMFGKGTIVFTTKGIYSNTVNYSWEHLKSNVYTDMNRCINMKLFSVTSDYEDDLFSLIEAFYVIFALASDYYNDRVILSYMSIKTNTPATTYDDMLKLSETEFHDKLKVLITDKTTYDHINMFLFEEAHQIEPLLRHCPNYKSKRFVMALITSVSNYGANKGIVFTDRGLYVVKNDREDAYYMPYSKLTSVSIRSSGEQDKIVLTGSDIKEQLITYSAGYIKEVAGILELVIIYYKSSAMRNSALKMKSKGRVEKLMELSDLIFEEILSASAQKIWWSSNVCKYRLQFSRDASEYAQIKTNHEAVKLTGNFNDCYITKIIFGLALFVSLTDSKCAKEGIVLTEKGIYIGKQSLYNKKEFYEYWKIENVSVFKNSSNRFNLEINDISLPLNSMISEKDANVICWMIEYIVQNLSGKDADTEFPYQIENKSFIKTNLYYLFGTNRSNAAEGKEKICNIDFSDVFKKAGNYFICPKNMNSNQNRIENAKSSYLEALGYKENETIYFLYDGSIIGNGKKGFTVTNKGIYSSGTKLLTKPFFISINDIDNIEYVEDKLKINNNSIDVSVMDKKTRTLLLQVLNQIVFEIV